MKRLIIMSFILMTYVLQTAAALPVSDTDLPQYADGLNVEGGKIWKHALSGDQIWANLAVVLDRPLATGVDLKQVTQENQYALKEASIDEYNEAKVNMAYASIIEYYIKNARALSHKPSNETVKLIFQIHRNSSAKPHFALLKKLITPLFRDEELVQSPNITAHNSLQAYIYKPANVYVEFRKGYDDNSLAFDKSINIVVSISLVAGFDPALKSGDLLIPNEFIPYNAATKELHVEQKYQVNNHLHQAVNDIIAQQNKDVIKITKEIGTENKHKKYSPKLLQLEDFKSAVIVESNGLFYLN